MTTPNSLLELSFQERTPEKVVVPLPLSTQDFVNCRFEGSAGAAETGVGVLEAVGGGWVAVGGLVAVAVFCTGTATSGSPLVLPLTVAYLPHNQQVELALPGMLMIQYPVDVFLPTTLAVFPTGRE